MNTCEHPASATVRSAFAREVVDLPVAQLRVRCPLVGVATHCKKFLQVLASVATVGLVEPLIVVRQADRDDEYIVLDGRLRLEALNRLGKTMATCMFATEDESYTYNRHVNRLTAGQDARMIALAVQRGVPQDRIAAVLGVNERTVKRRVKLLNGICPDAAALLADKNCPAATFEILKTLRPLRQLEAAELMCDQGNFTSAFARAIRVATPEAELLPDEKPHGSSPDESREQIDRLEREIASVQSKRTNLEEEYGVEHLHLAVSVGYVGTLLKNERIYAWLQENEALRFANLRGLVESEGPTVARRKSQKSFGC